MSDLNYEFTAIEDQRYLRLGKHADNAIDALRQLRDGVQGDLNRLRADISPERASWYEGYIAALNFTLHLLEN
jgi:hypothetical protein